MKKDKRKSWTYGEYEESERCYYETLEEEEMAEEKEKRMKRKQETKETLKAHGEKERREKEGSPIVDVFGKALGAGLTSIQERGVEGPLGMVDETVEEGMGLIDKVKKKVAEKRGV